ncbi:MAG: sugar transferase, partial [Bacteroidetes bacterium]|nr:sugar transferase [Bacteroidota bacterium]
RRIRVLKKYIRPFNWFYYTADVVFMRIFPKLPITKQFYFFITKGRNRVLTRAETFGRLYSCGFEIIDEETIDNKLYFVAKKIKEPAFDNDPSYGLLVRLKRIGKGGTIFNVYKLRTMHAYAEYLQEYVHKHNNLKEGGKFKNDFRITTEGKFFRKFWLDELPMLINLLKGNMKLVGVRPLSTHYFSLYTKELQEKRILHKPGLVPPYYADMPKNLDEIIASEMRYLKACEKHPFRTDVKYFFKAFYNIFFKGARSS